MSNFFNFAETAALHRGRIRLLRPIIWNGECLRPGSTVTLPPTILAALALGVDYETASEPQADIVDHPPRPPV